MSSYKEVAQFMEVNPQYQIFRRFDSIRLQIIYQLQRRLRVLEKEFEEQKEDDVPDEDILQRLLSTLGSYGMET